MKLNTVKSRLVCTAAAAALSLSAFLAVPYRASGNEIKVILNGSELSFGVEPKIVDGTVLVPMRKIFEELGAEVSWNSANRTVTAVKNGKSIIAEIGSRSVTVNGEVIEAAAAPIAENGTTLIPLRLVSEALGADVDWDGAASTVTVTKQKSAADEAWKENLASIDLSAMSVSGSGASVNGKIISVTAGGDYTVSGTAKDAMIYVNTTDRVKLRLSGASLTNTDGPAIFFDNCGKAYITVSKDTENYVADGAEYNADAKGAIFSNDDLEIKGSGSLSVVSSHKHGIASDDGIKIEEGKINITAVGDGIHANDGISVSGGEITIKATGDGVQSEDYVEITGGKINIVTDGEVAETTDGRWGFGGGRGRQMPEGGNPPQMPEGGNPPQMPEGGNPPQMPEGDFNHGTPPMTENAGEMTETAEAASSSKGIKADTNLIITGGEITVASTDHALHSGGIAFIAGGKMTLSSEKKKGISAHTGLVIDDGELDITKSTEGIESKLRFCINGGEIRVNASDDGLNAGGTNGRDAGTGSEEHSLYINGGYVSVNARGDGLDSNGTLCISGGTVIVSGPTDNGNGALDSGGSVTVTGGTLIAAGSSGMAEYPRGEGCTQPSISCGFAEAQSAGTIVRIEDSDGNELLTYRSPKSFQNIVFSSPLLEQGKSYAITLGGEYTGGSETDGVLSGGSFGGGTLAESFTLDSISKSVGASSRGFGRGGRGSRP